MRIGQKMIFDASQYRLGNLTTNLATLNEQITTGKKLNSLSDDPVGLTQVMNLRSTISSLDQLDRNISMGNAWLNAGETALSTISDQLTEAKTLALQMSNDTMTADQREDAAKTVNSLLIQMITLSNSKVNGQYVFSGTKTDTQPFVTDDKTHPTEVNYAGNHIGFSIKAEQETLVSVGHDGESVFWDDEILIDESNNMIDFIEYRNGVATEELTAVIPDGDYTVETLTVAIQNAMNTVSAASGNRVNYAVDYDSETGRVTIQDDGSVANTHVELLWATGTNSDYSVAPIIGFDLTEDVRDGIVSDNTVTGPVTITGGTNDTFQYIETVDGVAQTVMATLSAGTYTTAAELQILADDMETAMRAASPNGIDYNVSYNSDTQRFTIEEGGGTELEQVQILWSDASQLATDLGFDPLEDSLASPTGNHEVKWGMFDTMIELKEAMETNDRIGIGRAMHKLESHLKHMVQEISEIGSKKNRLTIRENIISETRATFIGRTTELEDTDIVDAITQLQSMDMAYQAALSSTAKIMQLSLVNYM
ncbi:MAG: flagellar hook-associated protein FlgL [Desulfobacterales bacterium]|nr:flagellar hook-associated protein FlgL [Desulfobacterales bacterium]